MHSFMSTCKDNRWSTVEGRKTRASPMLAHSALPPLPVGRYAPLKPHSKHWGICISMMSQHSNSLATRHGGRPQRPCTKVPCQTKGCMQTLFALDEVDPRCTLFLNTGSASAKVRTQFDTVWGGSSVPSCQKGGLLCEILPQELSLARTVQLGVTLAPITIQGLHCLLLP